MIVYGVLRTHSVTLDVSQQLYYHLTIPLYGQLFPTDGEGNLPFAAELTDEHLLNSD